jgi:O-antigen/teichoic acid export membrane protein
MSITSTSTLQQTADLERKTAKRQIRGSSLLLLGRLLTKGINFAVQVMIVRYLSQAEYGAFAYALAIVSMIQAVVTFGLDRAITRFVPIYQELNAYDKLFGTLIMVVSTMVSLGLGAALLFYSLQTFIAQTFISDQQAVALLLIMVFLAPIQALDELLLGLFAVLANPKAIFFRKHVVAPCLKLAVVLLLIMSQGTVFFLAKGYLAATTLGVAIYLVFLVRMLRQQNLFQHFNRQTLTIPWREVLTFTVPLLTSELVYVVMHTTDAIMLEYFQDITQVALLRAVQPTALLNQLVIASFATLFTPMAARMFARDDRQGINNLYWQTAIWIAVFSFPIFIVTFSIAQPITVLLYGSRYEQSAVILALLSFGYYFNAALGFNGLTLKVYGQLRYIVVLNILAALTNLIVNLLLIPHYGALGAAIGTTATLIVHNILKQTGLRLGTGISLFEMRYFRVYLIISAAALSVLLAQWLTDAPVTISLALAGIASLLVLRLNRHLLNVSQTFPELLRLPLMRHILGS